MDKRERRPISKGFQKAATRIENERIRSNLYRSYNCMECSQAVLVEKRVSAKKFKIKDPSGTVTGIVVYTVACKMDYVTPFEDGQRNNGFQCLKGDCKCNSDCTTCKFSEPVIVGIGVPYKIARNTRTSKGLSITRIVYRCTNVQRMKHFDSGTVMSAYVRCKLYERDDKKHAENR